MANFSMTIPKELRKQIKDLIKGNHFLSMGAFFVQAGWELVEKHLQITGGEK